MKEGFLADLMPPYLVAVCPIEADRWRAVVYDMRQVRPDNSKGVVAVHDSPTLEGAQRWAARHMLELGAIAATEEGEVALAWESLICGE